MIKIFLSLLLFVTQVFADDIYPPLPPITNSEVTITGTVSVAGTVDSNVITSVLPTGAATEPKQDDGNTSLSGIDSSANAIQASSSSIDSKLTSTNSSLSSIDSKLTAPLSVTGPLTDVQLRASLVPTTANQGGAWTVTANAGTNLNTSALALAATQTDRTQKSQITDGTRDGTVKAASTAAVAGDTSFVVALSPNSALPPGSNTIGALTANQSVNITQLSGAVLAATNPIPNRISDGAGFIASVVNSGNRYLANALIQNAQVSLNNNSTANLTAGSTFTGTMESTLGIAAIQVNLFSTEKSTAQVQQSMDGTNWDIVDSYVVSASVGDGRTIQATASFFRVLVTNNGAASTTSFRLQAVLTPVVEAVPRSLGPKTEGASLSVVTAENKTYSASAVGLVPPAAATDVFTITGSAGKTIKILRVELSGTTTAGSGLSVNASLVKRSTANSGGTSVATAITPHDSANSAATATVLQYTANPTLGTSVGSPRSKRYSMATAGSLVADAIWDFRTRPSQAVVLRGTGQVLAINLGGATITGPLIHCNIEWTEED